MTINLELVTEWWYLIFLSLQSLSSNELCFYPNEFIVIHRNMWLKKINIGITENYEPSWNPTAEKLLIFHEYCARYFCTSVCIEIDWLIKRQNSVEFEPNVPQMNALK